MPFIDLQNNGYAGVDFNGEPLTYEQLAHVHDHLQADGVGAILPTVVTDAVEDMARRLRDLRALIDQDPSWRRMFSAFHIEGPCLSDEDGYRGAHPPEHLRPATPELFEPLIEAAGGPERVAMVTLAPERDSGLEATRWISEHGIVVAAGHTNASLEMLREGEQAGITVFTHLGNGCPGILPRHDNIINRAFALEKVRYTFIPDGHHIPFFVLKMWLKQLGLERCVFVTDCMSAAGAPPGTYRLGGWELEVGEDRLVRPKGADHLAGSALTMREAYRHAVGELGLSEGQARALCSDYPRKLIGDVGGGGTAG